MCVRQSISTATQCQTYMQCTRRFLCALIGISSKRKLAVCRKCMCIQRTTVKIESVTLINVLPVSCETHRALIPTHASSTL